MPASAVVAKRFLPTFTTEAHVEIDGDELADVGWHHEDDCPVKRDPAPAGTADLGDAARQLHAAAGHRLADVAACGQEPCRSLPLDAVLTTMSSR